MYLWPSILIWLKWKKDTLCQSGGDKQWCTIRKCRECPTWAVLLESMPSFLRAVLPWGKCPGGLGHCHFLLFGIGNTGWNSVGSLSGTLSVSHYPWGEDVSVDCCPRSLCWDTGERVHPTLINFLGSCWERGTSFPWILGFWCPLLATLR